MNLEGEGAKIIPFPKGKQSRKSQEREGVNGDGFLSEATPLTPESRTEWENIFRVTKERVLGLEKKLLEAEDFYKKYPDIIKTLRSKWEEFFGVIPLEQAKEDMEAIRRLREVIKQSEIRMTNLKKEIADEKENLQAVEHLLFGS